MKKVLLVALSLLMITPVMQAKDKDEEVKIVLVKEENSDNYYYEGVVPVEGVTKEEMFKRAKEWVLSNFKTEDANVQFDDKELTIFNSTTVILGKNNTAAGEFVNFKLKLAFKDGRYKFRFDNLIVKSTIHRADPIKPYGEKMWPGGKYDQKVISKVNQTIFAFSVDLENHIKAKSSNDW